MKLFDRMHLWEIKKDIKRYESKVRFLKKLHKHLKKEFEKK